jgi:hypothetical protein
MLRSRCGGMICPATVVSIGLRPLSPAEATLTDRSGMSTDCGVLARYLYSHHMEDRLLPLKQTVRHALDPPQSSTYTWLGAECAGARGLFR